MRIIIVIFICIYLSLPFLLGLLVWNIEIFHLNAIEHTKHTINLQEIGDIDIDIA
jgi:hypothetical protein